MSSSIPTLDDLYEAVGIFERLNTEASAGDIRDLTRFLHHIKSVQTQKEESTPLLKPVRGMRLQDSTYDEVPSGTRVRRDFNSAILVKHEDGTWRFEEWGVPINNISFSWKTTPRYVV